MTRPARHLLISLRSVATRRWVVGRRFTVHLDDGDLTLTVARVRPRLDVRGFAAGELTGVRVRATDIHWRTSEFDNATVTLEHVQVRPGPPPVLVAAPVHVSIDVPTAALGDLVGRPAPRWAGEVGEDGVARVRFARRPGLGHVEVDVGIHGGTAGTAGTTLWLRAHTVALGTGRWRLPVRAPAYRVRLPEQANGLTLTGVVFTPGVVRVSGTVPRWQVPLDRKRLEGIVAGLGVGVAVNLARSVRPR